MSQRLTKKQREERRYLHKRGSVYYYQRQTAWGRLRVSTKQRTIDDAVEWRRLYEEQNDIYSLPEPEAVLFRDLIPPYLASIEGELSPSVNRDRRNQLAERDKDGKVKPIWKHFADRPVAEITKGDIQKFWNTEVVGAAKATATGKNWIDCLAGVLSYAQDEDHIEVVATDAFRKQLARRRRGKKARADAVAEIEPLTSSEVGRLLRAAEHHRDATHGPSGNRLSEVQVLGRHELHVAVILALDCGLRLGEVAGLHWQDITWGENPNLHIRWSLSQDGKLGPPKSGRDRVVQTSQRALRVLAAWRDRTAEAGAVLGIDGDRRGLVLRLDQANFRREWRKLVEQAQIEPRDTPKQRARLAKPKDLRDTYASHLLTAGVPIGYISQQLGHADVQVTQRHYARWIGGSHYRRGPDLEGRVPADLLAELGTDRAPTTTETSRPVSA